jgi:hypothetical protein
VDLVPSQQLTLITKKINQMEAAFITLVIVTLVIE